DLYVYFKTSFEDGNSFKQTFVNYPNASALIPYSVQQLLISGEQSGHLANSLIDLGNNFEQKTESTTKNLSTLLEPALLLVVWSGVVLVALAIILPIYSLVGG